MTNDERIERLRLIGEGLVDVFIHSQVAIHGLRIEIDALKASLLDDRQKEQFAQRIAAAANNFPPALQQLHVKLRRYREELEALRLEPPSKRVN